MEFIWNVVGPYLSTCLEVILMIFAKSFDAIFLWAEQLQDLRISTSDFMWETQIKGFDYVVGMLYSHFGEYLQPIFGNACSGVDAYPYKSFDWFIYNILWLFFSKLFFKGIKLWVSTLICSSLGCLLIDSLPLPYTIGIAFYLIFYLLINIDITTTGSYGSYTVGSYCDYSIGSSSNGNSNNYNTGSTTYSYPYNNPYSPEMRYWEEQRKREEEAQRKAMEDMNRRAMEAARERERQAELVRRQQEEQMQRWAREQQAINGQGMW